MSVVVCLAPMIMWSRGRTRLDPHNQVFESCKHVYFCILMSVSYDFGFFYCPVFVEGMVDSMELGTVFVRGHFVQMLQWWITQLYISHVCFFFSDECVAGLKAPNSSVFPFSLQWYWFAAVPWVLWFGGRNFVSFGLLMKKASIKRLARIRVAWELRTWVVKDEILDAGKCCHLLLLKKRGTWWWWLSLRSKTWEWFWIGGLELLGYGLRLAWGIYCWEVLGYVAWGLYSAA